MKILPQLIAVIYLSSLVGCCATTNCTAPESSSELTVTGRDLAEVLATDPWLLLGSWRQELPIEVSKIYSGGIMTFTKGNSDNQVTLTTTRVLRKDGSTTQQTRSYSEALSWLKGKMTLVSENTILMHINKRNFVRLTPRQYPPEQ